MEPPPSGNLLEGIPAQLPEELFTTLGEGPCRTGSVRVERIVSRGHASAEGFWYDQEEDEYVIVLQGAARMTLVLPGGRHHHAELNAMDWLYLPAHMRHRVDWTKPDEDTIWLAVYF